jgi:hydrogenase maturation factor HypE
VYLVYSFLSINLLLIKKEKKNIYVYSDVLSHLRKDVRDLKEVTSVRLFLGVCNMSKCIFKKVFKMQLDAYHASI